MVYFVSTQIVVVAVSMQQFLRGFGGFYQFDVSVCDFFGKKMGTAMASPLRGIQGQCNIKKCVEPAEIQQADLVRLTRTTEQKLFSNPRTAISYA